MLIRKGPLSGKVLFLDDAFESPHLEQHRSKEPSAKLGQPNLCQTSLWHTPRGLCVGSVCVCVCVCVHACLSGLCNRAQEI